MVINMSNSRPSLLLLTILVLGEPSAALSKEPSAALSKEPSAALSKEPSAALSKEPSAALSKEPSAALDKEPSAAINRESSAVNTPDSQSSVGQSGQADSKDREVADGLKTLTPEQIENYTFPTEEDVFKVSDLSVGELQILNKRRRMAKDLLARRLGLLSIKRTSKDLPILQQVIDRKILRSYQIDEWQALGVLFGDVLAHEFNLRWVRYEDDRGANRALRWRSTDNFVFPVTVFSKRVKYGEKVNVRQIYDRLSSEIESFKKWEARPKLPHTGKRN